MNSLSWLLYVADISDSLSFFLALVGVIGLIMSAIFFASGHIQLAENRRYADAHYLHGVNMIKAVKKWSLVPFMFVVMTCLLPSQQTVYMIAASEAGEQATQTPEFAKIRALLNKWLDDRNNPVEK